MVAIQRNPTIKGHCALTSHHISDSAAGSRAPTIHYKLSARGIGREVGAQEQNHVGDLVHGRVAPSRYRRLVALADSSWVGRRDLFLERMDHARIDRPRAHSIHPDAL